MAAVVSVRRVVVVLRGRKGRVTLEMWRRRAVVVLGGVISVMGGDDLQWRGRFVIGDGQSPKEVKKKD